MQVSLCKKGYFGIILGRKVDPHHPIERNKFLNHLDEAFSYLCTHISRYLLFHLEGLRTPRESWEKLEDLFGKQYELQGQILENELVALHPNNFETIEQFFTKFRSLSLQCIQCRIERKDEQNVLSILNKLGFDYSIFVSIFHSKRDSFPSWKIPSLDSFVESLIQEQDKLIRMGVIQTSKDQAILVTDSTKVQSKGRPKGKEPKVADSKPKENQETSEGASGFKKKKKFEKKKCPYCMRGFHPKDSCTKKTLDQMKHLCVQNNISLPQRVVMSVNPKNPSLSSTWPTPPKDTHK